MTTDLTGYTTRTQTGVSLVTCCKNRNENLLRAVPSWLAQADISEVVIVDWCSDVPVAQSLAEGGIADPRIRVVRVQNEPRWILSQAFNVGFRMARFDRILKVDADIVLAADFFAANPLQARQFVAGNWRTAAQGQAYINGFFVIHRADLMAVNGFNEYITTYGWDDDDLYNRLVEAGCVRVDVAPGTVHHLDHDDEARMDDMPAGARTGWEDLEALTMFKIRTNRFVATMMPGWNADRVMRPYAVAAGVQGLGDHVLDRAGGSLHVVPEHMTATARQLAAYELLSWRAGLRVFDLGAQRLDLLLTCLRLEAITPLHVELVLAGAPLDVVLAPRLLLVDVETNVLRGATPDALEAVWHRLEAVAATGRRVVMRGAQKAGPLTGFPQTAALPFLPLYYNVGTPQETSLAAVAQGGGAPVQRLRLSRAALGLDETAPAAPAVSTGRARLFIDAQHGLGNRLRAIGSAAAVARATNRELVVVWAPDFHCDGPLSDLFDYPGAVLDTPFIEQARAGGMSVVNYMEIEAGSDKGAPVVLVEGRDAYVRSAYVLAHPASTWESENIALRALTPSAAVRDLMARVPGTHRDIALHVRMEGAQGTDTQAYDSIENWTAEGHAAIQDWRGKSHYARFMARLDVLLREDPAAQVFLAADLPETYAAFARTYGDRVAGLERRVFDRSAEQLHYALADMLLLARCRHLLGSNWSSFSEGAQRFSTTIKTRELAGVNF
jgi:hypothetical protein